MVSSNRQSEHKQNPTSGLCLYSPCTRTIFTFKLFSIHLLCICLCIVCLCVHGQHVYVEIRAQFLRISSLLPPWGSWGSTMFVPSLPPFLSPSFSPFLPYFFLPLPSFFSSLSLFICPDFFLSFLQSYKKYLQEESLTVITECVVETKCSLQSQLFAFGYRLKTIIVIVLEDL